VHFYYSLSEKR